MQSRLTYSSPPLPRLPPLPPQVQTTTMCISVSLSGSVVLGCLFAPKIHIILFQPQKNVASLRVTANRFSATVSTSVSAPSSAHSKGIHTTHIHKGHVN